MEWGETDEVARTPIAEPPFVSPSLPVLRVNRPEAVSRWRISPRNTLKRPSDATEGGREKEGLRMFWPRSHHMFLDMKDFMSERSETNVARESKRTIAKVNVPVLPDF